MIDVLAKKLEEYVDAIVSEYKDYIPKERLIFLKGIKNYRDYIVIENTKMVSCLLMRDKIYFPAIVDVMMELWKWIPGYGMNGLYNFSDSDDISMVNLFLTGYDAMDFYLDNLVRGSFLFCGMSSKMGLGYGMMELKAEELAIKYNLDMGWRYPKERDIAEKLQLLLGIDLFNQLSFMSDDVNSYELLKQKIGVDGYNMYKGVSFEMEKEFCIKVERFKYSGIGGIVKRRKKYRNVDYKNAMDIMNDYKTKRNRNV